MYGQNDSDIKLMNVCACRWVHFSFYPIEGGTETLVRDLNKYHDFHYGSKIEFEKYEAV